MLGRRKDIPPTPAPPPAPPAHAAPAPRTTPTELRTAPAPTVHKKLGEFLVDQGAITGEQLAEALAVQKEEGGFLGQLLVRLGFTTQEAVASCLVKQCKIPHLSLLDYDIGSDVLNLIPREVCRKFNLLPIDKLGRILTVAMVDPLDIEALHAVQEACPELRIKPILCNWEHFALVSRKLFADKEIRAPEQISASGLGLSEAPAQAQRQQPAAAKPPAARPDVPEAELQQAVNELAKRAAATAPSAAPSTAGGSGEVATVIRDSIRESMHELAAALNSQRASGPDSGLSAHELGATLRDAMKEALAGLTPAQAAPEAPGISGANLAEMIRDSVGGAIQEALATVVLQLRSQPAPAPAAQAAGLEQVADIVRDSVGGAIQEAMAAMVVQMRAMAGKHSADPGLNAEQLAAVLREGLSEAARYTQEATAAQLGQIAEAAQQISQLVEAAAVTAGNRQDLERLQRRGHESVTPFGPGQPADDPARLADDERVLDAMESEKPIEGFTFETFFAGGVNTFTHKVAQAVSADPGGQYNPFFLFGDVGVGKTHLISAVGNAILQGGQQPRVGYVSASHFARRLADAQRAGAVNAFRENYCHWDVLILDDIQFLGGRVDAQEEFFHIFNVLHQARRQIIIASDKAPDRLGLLEQRLISRFASGIVAQLKAPEWETRLAILRHQAQAANADVPEAILSLIAMRVPNDVRKMAGSLRKIVAYAQLVGQDITCELANEILSHLGAEAA